MSISLLYNCRLLFRPAVIDGNVRGHRAFNSAVNTNLNVRNNTREAFILHTLDAQCASTTLKAVGRKKGYDIIPQEAWEYQMLANCIVVNSCYSIFCPILITEVKSLQSRI